MPDENEAAYDMKRQRVYAFVLIPGECEKVSMGDHLKHYSLYPLHTT